MFGQFEGGGAHTSGANLTGSAGPAGRNNFAYGVAGGLDFLVAKRFAVHLVQFEVVFVPGVADMRFSGGLGFRFGGARAVFRAESLEDE